MGDGIDLNVDLGEGFGAWSMGDDEAMLDLATSANVACGFHAGDPEIMHRTVAAASRRGVHVGAHPSFPDLQGFGRRRMDGVSPGEVERLALYQAGALAAIARPHGVAITHIRTHGALAHVTEHERAMAEAVSRAAAVLGVAVMCFAGSEQERVCREQGRAVIRQAYVDRGYTPDGGLVPRGTPGAIIHDPELAAARALRMVQEKRVVAIDGSDLPIFADTLVLHGDTPGAVAMGRAVRRTLEEHGVHVRPFPLP